MRELTLLLKKFFGYDSFRPLQEEVIQRIIQKKDTLVLMPTGGGKSICYQLPALHLEGTALVISPLIALMKDQVEGLIANGIPAAALNSMLPEEERQRIRQHCMQGKIKLLYISPEKVMGEMDWLLSRTQLSLIAIDEAHCVSHWGHDFRPEYTQLAILKERFPGVPVVALTATADKVTRSDILKQLNLDNPETFISSFDRPNLSLNVLKGLAKKEKTEAIAGFIRNKRNLSGIVYCMRRADTEAVAAALANYNIQAVAYHAGLSPQQREKAQNDFINDRIQVVCATVAFGMGIDKSNVRWVIHYNMPGSIENYYQEIGRAGRDGLNSDTLLFYTLGDMILLRRFAEESGQKEINLEKLNRMQRYCETDVCRRRILLNYFGEESEKDCGNCDVCRNPPERFNGTEIVQKALSGIARTQEKIPMHLLIDLLRGTTRPEMLDEGYHRLKTFGIGKDLPYDAWKEYLYQMLHLGHIEIDYADNRYLKITPLGRKVLYGEMEAQLALYTGKKPYIEKKKPERKTKTTAKRKASPIRPIRSDSMDEILMDALRQLRKNLAERENMPAYIIFSDAALADMVERRPLTLEEFREVKGVGEAKLEKFGKIFIALISFVLKNGTSQGHAGK